MKYSLLHQWKTTFSSALPKIKAAALLSSFVFAIDLFLTLKQAQYTIQSYNFIRPETNFHVPGFSEALLHHGMILLIFLILVSICLVGFQIRKPIYFCLGLLAYILFLAIIHHPQILQPTQINEFLPSDRSFLTQTLFGGICSVLWLAMAVRVFNIFRQKKAEQSINAIFALTLSTGIMFLNWQSLSPQEAQVQVKSNQSQNEDIIVISIDALRADAEPELIKHANPSFKKFLENSQKAENAIADVPQSHGSFVSLFSGLRPYQSGVRYAFHAVSGNRNQDVFHTLKEIKKQGYKINFLRDEMETAVFYPGTVIDEVIAPRSATEGIRVGYFYASLLTYGLFDNWVGQVLYPDAYGSPSFFFGKKPHLTAEKFGHYLNKSSEERQFLFFHSCLLHAPLVLPYPYYPPNGEGKIDGVRFAYPTLLKPRELSHRAALQAETKFNETIYKASLRYLVEQLLNPTFEYLEKSGKFEKSKIFLISDHGENLWSEHDKLVGTVTMPLHGDTLLFGSKSEFAYFRALNSERDIDPKAEINLSQGLRKALGLSFDDNLIYSENAFIPFQQSESLINVIGYQHLFKHFRFSDNPKFAYVGDEFMPMALTQMQRAVYQDGFKLLLYPTFAGPRLFLCEYKTDPTCQVNLLGSETNRKVELQLLEKLTSVYKKDVEMNLAWPAGLDFYPDVSVSEIQKGLQSPNQWVQFIAANTLYFAYQNFELAEKTFADIFENTSDSNLKELIAKTSVNRCFHADENTEEFYGTISQYREKAYKYPHIYWWRHQLSECMAKKYGMIRRQETIFSRNWLYDDIYYFRIRGNLPEVSDYLENLAAKFNIKGKRKISDLIQSLPAEARQNETMNFISYLKERLHYFFEYRLLEEQVPYYFIKFISLNALGTNPDKLILQEILRQATHPEFELRFFNYLENEFKLPDLVTQKDSLDRRSLRLNRLKKTLGL